ncbi:mucin-binding protein [Lactococcus lactis]|uniref:mucin-binding protein n=1 Tax=Lactococcus lactis TaxID=1358 RepID=UPI001D17DC9E|nr:hypothetical protein [Lactococcus lactis]MCC4119924.1 hypothetical protein [Lactococcus lactis]
MTVNDLPEIPPVEKLVDTKLKTDIKQDAVQENYKEERNENNSQLDSTYLSATGSQQTIKEADIQDYSSKYNTNQLVNSQEGANNKEGAVVSDESFTLTANVKDFPNYSVSSYSILGISGTFTIDESQVSNGQSIKITDISVASSVASLEAKLSNQTSTTIKNESGEILGVLSLEGDSLMLTISSDYSLKGNQEKFTFSNNTALKLLPTKEMVSQNVDVIETVTIGTSSVDVIFHQQETFDLTTLTKNQVDLQLGSGKTGYTSSRIYDVAYNQEGLTELQSSNGTSTSGNNLKKGDYQIATTLSSNVIPTSGTIFLATYVVSESNSRLQTNNNKGLASLTATSHEKTVSLPLKQLAGGLTLQQIMSQVISGEDATYVSRQVDGNYLSLQNVSENTLTISEENLRDTTNAPTTFTDPNGDATVEYYGKALNNRSTQATAWINFDYVDSTVTNTVVSEMLNPDSGEVLNTASKESLPQDVSAEGQSTVKEHYVDEKGLPLDTVTINHGWPTNDSSHGGKQFNSSSKDFEGYIFNSNVTSIPNIDLSDNDFISTQTTNIVDYPKSGTIANIYYVYSQVVHKAVINYIDDTTGDILKSDTVTGIGGELINYGTSGMIQDYISQGYKLVSSAFKDGEEKFDTDEIQNQVYEVHLSKIVQKATINYINDATGETLNSDTVSGPNGQAINYTTFDKIKDYESNGYALVSNSFKDGEEKFDTDETQDQVFEVHLKQGTPSLPKVDDKINDKSVIEKINKVEPSSTTSKANLPETGQSDSVSVMIIGSIITMFGIAIAFNKRFNK